MIMPLWNGFVFTFGLCIGSFLNMLIYRLPREEPVVKASSRCTSCGLGLKPLDLVPVLSYVFLRGRCRYCGAKVSPRYPAVELITGAAFVLLLNKFSFSASFAAAAFLMSVLIAVLFIDLDYQIIPDELVIAGLAGGLLVFVYNIFYPVAVYGDRNWWNPLAGIAAGSGILFLVALIGAAIYKTEDAMGMGDVKIFAPIGLFLGWRMTLLTLLVSIVAAGVAGVLLLLFRRKEKNGTIPLGPFIAASVFFNIMWGWDLFHRCLHRFLPFHAV